MKTWTVLIAATTANRRFFEKFLDKFNKNSVKANACESQIVTIMLHQNKEPTINIIK